MKKILTLIFCLAALTAGAQVIPTPTGAKITLDSVTTEVIIYSPDAVRVVKYKGERPNLPKLKIKGVPKTPEVKELKTAEGHNKYKVDTGKYYAAINDKDGNVSFWSHDDKLILAEQHKSGRIVDDPATGHRSVFQDFQMGLSKVDSLFCARLKAADRVNLMGKFTSVGNKEGGLPVAQVKSDKLFEILWQGKEHTTLDARPREGKTNGDITFHSLRPIIDYVFLRER